MRKMYTHTHTYIYIYKYIYIFPIDENRAISHKHIINVYIHISVEICLHKYI